MGSQKLHRLQRRLGYYIIALTLAVILTFFLPMLIGWTL